MSRSDAIEQYNHALKLGQKYYRDAMNRGVYPYTVVLDDILDDKTVSGYENIGLIQIPSELIVGTKSAGRTFALAGNFMPILGEETEFGSKWVSLCEAHLSEEGIRDPVKCFEYMGRFYVEEGNKRVSVLKSYGDPTIQGMVTRIVPSYSADRDVQIYYEFMRFYSRSRMYGVRFHHSGGYTKLQALLGMDPEHEWTEVERRSFAAGFSHFRDAFNRLNTDGLHVTPAEALLVWLEVFSFADIKELTLPQLVKELGALWPDIRALAGDPSENIKVRTEPEKTEDGFMSRFFGVGRMEHLNAAFIYAYSPEESAWIRAHDHGREYIEQRLGSRITVRTYSAYDHDYYGAMEKAVADGAQVIFATTSPMIEACRRISALHRHVKVLNCALSLPYTGVRMYYCRLYECKFITGAIAGAMAENNRIGYVASYPVFGVSAEINAFALGVRMTNPRAQVALRWSCIPGDPLSEFTDAGISVISNKDATNPVNSHWNYEWGTYKLQDDGNLLPLAVPCWNWGRFYEKVIHRIMDGSYEDNASRAINYWWGLDSGVIDIQLSEELPDGVRSMAELLKKGIAGGSIDPFRTRIIDRDGTVRNDGTRDFPAEELMTVDWLCDNVEGRIPAFDELVPRAKETVRLIGLYRDELQPETEGEKQL